MAVLKIRDIKTNLCKKGFEQNSSRDHIYLEYKSKDGKKTVIYTKVRHGAREIDGYLIGKMAQQTRLNKENFIKLVNCTLSGEDYYKIVQNLI